MQLKRIFSGSAIAAILMMLSPHASAARIDFTGRDVPLSIAEDGTLSTTLESRVVPPGQALDARFSLSDHQAEHAFAILVPTTAATTVTINGKEISLRPAYRSDAVVYPLFSSMLKSGENNLHIQQAVATPWAGTIMFSLKNGFEEAHFPFDESAGAGDIAAREFPPASNQQDYDVQYYDCTWIPRVGSAYMEAGSQVIMGAKALSTISYVDVDFDMGGYSGYNGSMVLDTVDSGVGTPSLSTMNLPNADTPRIRVFLPRTYAAGESFQVRIAYHGAPNPTFPKSIFGTRPAFTSRIDSGGVMIYSESQPYGGRRWWPCKDHPSDKATTSIQRIIVPNNTGSNLTAVSNGSLESTINHGATTEFVWVNHYPIATYLVSLAISNYEYYGGQYTALDGVTQMPVGAYIRPANRAVK